MTLFSLYDQKLIRLTDDQGNTYSLRMAPISIFRIIPLIPKPFTRTVITVVTTSSI